MISQSSGIVASVCLTMVSTMASAGTFADSFSSGLDPDFWTISKTTDALYSVDTSAGRVGLAKSAVNSPGGFQAVTAVLALANLGGNIAGDFSTQIDFDSAAITGGNFNQVQLNVFFANGTFFMDVFDNDGGLNKHVFGGNNGNGRIVDGSTSGTFRIERVNGTVRGFFNSQVMTTVGSNAPVSAITFSLQNNGTNDPISVHFDNFSVTGASVALPTPVPEPGTWAMLAVGLGIVGWGATRRTRAAGPA